ncbi:RHS repeat-associated core domain-containing protein [Pseudofrankia sp. DC12]|uniref:RHS repeat-associated core domain-containing protein n=1 Tax=Pseudofrankia sp. DC12 TaxID=683315 RepID=UPI00069918A9|nr:RHS repeat-associated core domain-containing protein [Pseudofrankia sp. DC12]
MATGGDTQRKTTFTYDNDDRQIWQTDGSDSFDWATYGTTYDPNGNVATTKDPDGTFTAYTYTDHNQLATTTLKDFVDDPVAGTTPRDLVLESRAYDPAGRLASVTDSLGRTTQHTYWLDDLPRQTVLKGYRPPDLVNGVLSGPGARDIVLDDRTYDAAGNLTQEITGGGKQTVTTSYDQADRVSATTLDPNGLARATSYSYDANNDVTSTVTSASGASTTERTDYGYDNASRLTSQTVFGDGTATYVTSYTRDQRGYATGVTDPRGYGSGGTLDPAYTTNFVTDASGRLAQTIEPSEQIEENGGAPAASRPSEEVGYDTFGDLTQSRDARNNVTTTSYNTLSRPYKSVAPSYTPPGGSAITPTAKWTYDSNGNVLTHTDPSNQVTTTVYDKLNRPVSVTDPQVTGASAAGVTRLLYDDAGNLRTTVDQDGAWTWFGYDDLNRRWTTTETERSPQGAYTTYTDHDDAGNVNRVLTWANVSTQAASTASYDAAGELVDAHDALGKLTHYGYDLSGHIASVTDPLGRQTRYTYDRAGRLTTTAQYSPSNTLLRSSSTGYDAAGNATSRTDPNGHVTTATYDALSQPRSITVPVASGSSITSSAGYDAAGNKTRATDGKGNVTAYTFNSLGLPETTTEPSTTAYPAAADRTWTTSYNANGKPTTDVEPGGVTQTASYDELGRVTGVSGTGGGATAASASFGYDLASQLTSASHPSGTEAYTYDDRGLLTGSSGPAGNASFGYDVNGRVTSRNDAGANSTFGYNARDDLTSLTTNATGTTAALTYTDAGQLSTVTYASGNANSTVRTFLYDDLGRTASDTLTNPSGTLRGQSYVYDNNDNLTSTTFGPLSVAGAGTQSYGYDWANRLTSYTNQANTTTTYGWDAAGNRTSVNGTTATFDARNRLTSDGTASYSYTARGTLSTRTAGSTTTTTSYNALDQLTGETTGSTTTSYAYDALGRVATRNGTALSYAGTESEPVSDNVYGYTHTPAGDTFAVSSWAGGWDTFSNTHGDLVAAATPTATALADSRCYDPFGTPTAAGITHIGIGYQGSWTDPTTGRVDAESRWYSPGTGTFSSRDGTSLPWTGTAADNLYTYAGANPLGNNDPTGRYLEDLVGVGTRLAEVSVPFDEEPVGWLTTTVAGGLVVIGLAGSILPMFSTSTKTAPQPAPTAAPYRKYGPYRPFGPFVLANPAKPATGTGTGTVTPAGGCGTRCTTPPPTRTQPKTSPRAKTSPAPRIQPPPPPPPPIIIGPTPVSGTTQDVHPLADTSDQIKTAPAQNPAGWGNGDGYVYEVPDCVDDPACRSLLLSLSGPRDSSGTGQAPEVTNPLCGADSPGSQSLATSCDQAPATQAGGAGGKGGGRPPHGPSQLGADAGGDEELPIPKGFSSRSDFERFSALLKQGLSSAGYDGTDATFQGSSVTGRSFRTGEPFDGGRVSDYDIALGGEDIFEAARSAGVGLRGGGIRTGPLKGGSLARLGLADLQDELTSLAGRPVNFMIGGALSETRLREALVS